VRSKCRAFNCHKCYTLLSLYFKRLIYISVTVRRTSLRGLSLISKILSIAQQSPSGIQLPIMWMVLNLKSKLICSKLARQETGKVRYIVQAVLSSETFIFLRFSIYMSHRNSYLTDLRRRKVTIREGIHCFQGGVGPTCILVKEEMPMPTGF
jgi:hypothetical protein